MLTKILLKARLPKLKLSPRGMKEDHINLQSRTYFDSGDLGLFAFSHHLSFHPLEMIRAGYFMPGFRIRTYLLFSNNFVLPYLAFFKVDP